MVDGDGVIIIGHVRHQAAQLLGIKKIPVHIAADLDPDRVRALRIADNKTGEIADWDIDLLDAELAALQETEIDFAALALDIVRKSGKHKYLYPLTKDMEKRVRILRQAYPKQRNSLGNQDNKQKVS